MRYDLLKFCNGCENFDSKNCCNTINKLVTSLPVDLIFKDLYRSLRSFSCEEISDIKRLGVVVMVGLPDPFLGMKVPINFAEFQKSRKSQLQDQGPR